MPPATLLLATERTEFDAGAERIALALAQQLQVPVRVVCPLETNPELIAVAPDLAARQEACLLRELDTLAAQARAARVTMATAVRRGEGVAREIAAAAREAAADLLVMRRLGKRGWLARLTVGEIASQVAAQSPCPLLLVPRDAQPWTARALAVLTGQQIGPLAHLVSLLGVGSTVEVACFGGASVPPAVEQAARAAGIALHPSVAAGDWAQALPSLARRDVQLVALPLTAAAVGHGKLASSYEAMLGALACPALLVRAD
ncbi:MAG TPA: universal stress protein [Burkholderiaceae bacterium]|nr:universal stress protein [Burkholderiaceae bacterium]